MSFADIQIGLDNLIRVIQPMLSIWFPALLVGTGILYSVLLGAPQIRNFKVAILTMFGKAPEQGEGDINPRQALFSAVSGTVGTGNIGGVAVAIGIGGPSALFWMWVTATLGMAIKLAEISVSHKYRTKLEDGTISGGPMYVLDKRLNLRWLAAIFAVMTVFNVLITGNSIQITTMADALDSNMGIAPWVTTLVLGGCLAATILGGVKVIARVAEMLIPSMGALYIGGCLVVIFAFIGNLGDAFVQIFSGVFNGSAATGGFLGATVAYAMNTGVNRGLFSNEAGQGSSPIAHAASRETNSIREGALAMLEPFIDTLVVCSLTGLALLCSGVWIQKYEHNLEQSNMYYFAGELRSDNEQHAEQLGLFLVNQPHELELYSGDLHIASGRYSGEAPITVMGNRSLAEDVHYFRGEELFDGSLHVRDGRLIADNVRVRGKALLTSVELTSKAFSESPLGFLGPLILTLSLTLFAFSTAIVWSYYGDRSIAWFFGARGVLPFRLAYLAVFLISAFVDASLLWRLSIITTVLMAIPNLISILILAREVREDYRDWDGT